MVSFDHELGGLLDMVRTDVLKFEPSVLSALVHSRLPDASARVVAADEKVEAVHDSLFRRDPRDVE